MMSPLQLASTIALLLAVTDARAQSTAPVRVETVPLELTSAERFRVPIVLEPARRVAIASPTAGTVQIVEIPLGAAVREGQVIAQLDRSEVAIRLKLAQAEHREKKAELDYAGAAEKSIKGAVQGRLDAAQARVELAELAVARTSLRAPFAGRLLDVPAGAGQYVAAGSPVAELADVSSLRALVPVERSAAKVGTTARFLVEGRPVEGKIQSVLPLPSSYAALHELATPLAAAWVVAPNADGALEPGLRVDSPALPTGPVATIPAPALAKGDDAANGMVRVLRGEYVAEIPVRVLGRPGPDRVQISGPLRPADALIVSSTVPLVAGTLVRLSGQAPTPTGPVEPVAPDPTALGTPAEVTPPAASPTPAAARSRVAPIGPPGSALPKTAPRPATAKPATPKGNTSGVVPF